ncbi:MAG: DUF1552 domain-containing protein [Myxococcales bacterium]|nr:DUF1552 domain-containing protein [Myxococcales bacterium]
MTRSVASRWQVGTRRSFLRGVGAAGLALPFLRERAAAAPGDYPVRLIVCSVLNGLVPADRSDRWECVGDEKGLTLSPMLQALAPVRDKVVAFKGIDNKAPNPRRDNGHDPCLETLLRGYNQVSQGAPSSPSVDQFIASKLNAKPLGQLGVSVRGNVKSPFYSVQGGRLPVEASPHNVFARVFGDFVPDPGAEAQAALRRRNKRSVLDYLRTQTSALKGELCGHEKEMLDAHLGTIEKAQSVLDDVPVQAGACNPTSDPGNIDLGNQSMTPKIADAQVATIAAAVACQRTPVVSFSMLGDYQMEKYPFVSGVDPSKDYHDYAHSGAVDIYQRLAEWWIGRFANLVQTLDSIPEGDGTVLDHSLVVLISDMRVGGAHDINDIPLLTVGGAGGQIKTNRVLKYSSESMNNFLVSLCHVMGVNVATFGNPAICSGPLSRFV